MPFCTECDSTDLFVLLSNCVDPRCSFNILLLVTQSLQTAVNASHAFFCQSWDALLRLLGPSHFHENSDLLKGTCHSTSKRLSTARLVRVH